ncbi:MAG: peptidase, partial [Pontixanthobacter sp.]
MRYLTRSIVLLTATVTLGGCTMYLGDDGYGYNDAYYDDYGQGAYYGAVGPSYYGWYDDYYYPGVGAYIYDRRGYRQGWNDRHRRYWEGRRGGYDRRANWGGYRQHRDGYYYDD